MAVEYKFHYVQRKFIAVCIGFRTNGSKACNQETRSTKGSTTMQWCHLVLLHLGHDTTHNLGLFSLKLGLVFK